MSESKQATSGPTEKCVPAPSLADPNASSKIESKQLDCTSDFDANTVPMESASAAPGAPLAYGRYIVKGVQGRGGFGTVYLGHDSQLDRPVAIKVQHSERKLTAEDLERFLQEARRVARLRHSSIVTVHDVGVQDDQCYIVSDFVTGSSLRDFLKRQRPTWQDSARIVAALADALAHAHSQRTVHRDVKPGNIIMRPDQTPVLVDFGLGIDETATTKDERGRVAGTPGYMSPEQAWGEGHRIDGRTDIYSLGVVLYEMLTGRVPFYSSDIQEMMRQVREDEPQPPRQLVHDVPREMERICLKALAKRIGDRYTTAGDFAEDLRQTLNQSANPIVVEPSPASATKVMPSIVAPTPPPQATEPPSSSSGPITAGPGRAPGASSSSRRAREAERRQLTVMYCDLADSATLAERLDPEDLHDVLREYQKLCAETVLGGGGHVAQSIGDGLLVCFGYPVAREDAALQAVRAGFAVLETVARLSRRLDRDKGVRLAVQVGIHTGLVVAGETAAAAGNEPLSIVGEARSVAAGLQAIAPAGAVVLSAATLRLVEGYFVCEPLGGHKIKGVSRPIEVYRVQSEKNVLGRIEVAGPTGLTPLVGRDREVGLLVDRWEQAKEGMGQIVMLVGEPGIGKSRLIHVTKEHVLAEHSASQPRNVVECRCAPQFQNSGLNPVSDYFERVLQFERDQSPDEKLAKLETMLVQLQLPLPQFVPLLASLLALPLPNRYPPHGLTPERLKQKTLEALVDWLRRSAEKAPVLCIVEDLHWVDASTLEWLAMLIEQGQTERVLLMLTFRPEFTPPWTGAHLTQVPLPRLTKRQVAEMVGRKTGAKSLPPEVAEQVAARTDGVPLFVEECTKMLLESGLLRDTGSAYELTGPLPQGAIPATLHDLLMARLDRLGDAKTIASSARRSAANSRTNCCKPWPPSMRISLTASWHD